jgi:hypothetical protein
MGNKLFLKFKHGVTSPEVKIAFGEYHREFDAKDAPFEVTAEEREGLLVHAPDIFEIATAPTASAPTAGNAGVLLPGDPAAPIASTEAPVIPVDGPEKVGSGQ